MRVVLCKTGHLRKRKESLDLGRPKTDPCSLSEGQPCCNKIGPICYHLGKFMPSPFMPLLFHLLWHWSCSDTWLEDKSFKHNLILSKEEGPSWVLWANVTFCLGLLCHFPYLVVALPQFGILWYQGKHDWPRTSFTLWTSITTRKIIILPRMLLGSLFLWILFPFLPLQPLRIS